MHEQEEEEGLKQKIHLDSVFQGEEYIGSLKVDHPVEVGQNVILLVEGGEFSGLTILLEDFDFEV